MSRAANSPAQQNGHHKENDQPASKPPPQPYFPLEEEENVVLPLSGMNECSDVLMWGWTKNIPLEFPRLKPDLRAQLVDLSKGRDRYPKFFNPDYIKDAIELEECASRARHDTYKIMDSLDVVVLAKRSIHTMVHQGGKLLMFGNITVGDSSGFCEIVTMNNSIQTLYAEVNVGDRLIIRDGKFKTKYVSDFKSCFNESYHLDMEIKVREYECRRIFKIINPTDSQWNVNLIPEYVTHGKELRLPSRLPEPLEVFGINPGMASHEEYFDIMGVLSHVGRMERIWQYDWPLEIRGKGLETHPTYSIVQTVELIDSTEPDNPLPVTLFMNADNWTLQPQLTPGCLVIFTNVMKPNPGTDYGHRRITSTVFTKIYMNEGTTKYLEKMSRISANAAMQMFSSPGGGMRGIYEREDVRMSVGGHYAKPFASEGLYAILFSGSESAGGQLQPDEGIKFKSYARVPKLPFVHRQTQPIHFKGRVLKFRVVSADGTEKMWCTNNFPKAIFNYQKFNSIYPFHPDRNWYSFTYKLPKLDLEQIPRALANLGSRERLSEFARMSYEKYCGNLLIPPKENSTTAKPDLPMVDGPPYYWVMIADDQHRHLYECLWKPSRYFSLEQMKTKLERTKDVGIMGVIEIFCMNPNAIDVLKYEVLLQDFTPVTSRQMPMPTPTPARTVEGDELDPTILIQLDTQNEEEDVNMEEIEQEMSQMHSESS